MFKKMLLTLSVLTLAMGGVGNAADADWTFYGAGHVSINSLNNGEDSQLGLTSNTSRFGFKGTAPINDDFSAFWQFESELDMAGNEGSYGTVIGTRNTYVGFKHATAGKFMFGRHDTPFKTLGRKVEMFADELGDFRMLTSRGPLASMRSFNETVDGVSAMWEVPNTTWDSRLTEIAAWVSPDFNGVTVFLAYQFDQRDKLAYTGDAKYERDGALSGSMTYEKDELFFGASYEVLGLGSRPSGVIDPEEVPVLAGYGDKANGLRFVAKYSTEQVTLSALYQSISSQMLAGANVGDGWEYAFGDVKATTMGLGAKFMATDKVALKGAYFMQDEFTDFDADGLKPSMMALGLDYMFNEKVKVYAQWARISNDVITNVALAGGKSGFGESVYGAPKPATDESALYEDPSGFSVGTVITW